MNHDVPPGLEDRLQQVLLTNFFPDLAVEELFIVDHLMGDPENAGFTTFYLSPGKPKEDAISLNSEQLQGLTEFLGGEGFDVGHNLDVADNELIVSVYGVKDWSAVEARVSEAERTWLEQKARTA